MPKAKAKPYRIEVIEYETAKVTKTLKYESEHRAERADDGLNRNLDHEKFYTVIKGPDDK